MREKIIDLLYAENVRSDCGIERLADEICAIDAAQVIRCKDCKHSEESIIPYRDLWCEIHEIYTDINYFCADGRRKG